MKTKEEYYASVLSNRELAASKKVAACTCPHPLCDWHGRCTECVALHRYRKNHVPFCLQPIIAKKLQALAGTIEMAMVKKQGTPIEYRRYVK